MDRDRIDSLAAGLRLLSHPGLGAQGISDGERQELRDAARTLEQLHQLASELAGALGGVMDYGSIAHGDAFTALSHWHHADDTRRNGSADPAGMGAQELSA